MTFNTITIGTVNVVYYAIFMMVNFTRNYQSIQMFCHVHRTYLLPGIQMGYLFSSRPTSLWPLYLVINELPPKKRFSKDNMILAGLWFGYSKPAMWIYLKPSHSSLSKLEKDGTTVESPD